MATNCWVFFLTIKFMVVPQLEKSIYTPNVAFKKHKVDYFSPIIT